MQNKFYKQTYELYGPTKDAYLNTIINAVVTNSSKKYLLDIVNSPCKPSFSNPLINTLFNNLHYSYPKLTLLCIEALVNVGVNINDTDSYGYTILHGLSNSEPGVISDVVKLGANINAVDILGRTPLQFYSATAGSRSKDNILKLIELGADVDIKNHEGETSLTTLLLNWSFNEKDTSIVEAMIDAGKTIDINDKNGIAPLPALVLRNNCKVISYIFKRYPYLIQHINDKYDGAAPLHHLLNIDHYDDVLEKIELLLSLGADINTIDSNQKPLLKCTFNVNVANFLIHHTSYKNLKIGSLNQTFKVFTANFRTPAVYKKCADLNNNFHALTAKAEQENLSAKLLMISNNKTVKSLLSLKPPIRL